MGSHHIAVEQCHVAGVLQQGKKDRKLKFTGSAAEAAQMLVGALEGAMMIARSYGDVGRFTGAADRTLASLAA